MEVYGGKGCTTEYINHPEEGHRQGRWEEDQYSQGFSEGLQKKWPLKKCLSEIGSQL